MKTLDDMIIEILDNEELKVKNPEKIISKVKENNKDIEEMMQYYVEGDINLLRYAVIEQFYI